MKKKKQKKTKKKQETNNKPEPSPAQVGNQSYLGYIEAQHDFNDHEGCRQCYAAKVIKEMKENNDLYTRGFLIVAYEYHVLPHECGGH